MKPRTIAPADLAYWRDETLGCDHRPVVFTSPAEIDAGIEPVEGIVSDTGDQFGRVARVAWQLDEIELAHLARGGTIWLSTWGGLPVHNLSVQPPTTVDRPDL